jgi:hypothetical protein
MASGLEIASHIQYEPACAVMLALSNLAASSSSVNPGNDQPYSQFDRRHIRLSESRIASLIEIQNVDNDIPAVRNVRIAVVMLPWLFLATLLIILLISFGSAS